MPVIERIRCGTALSSWPLMRAVPALGAMSNDRFVRWSFDHYLNIAHPDFAISGQRKASTAENTVDAGSPQLSAATAES